MPPRPVAALLLATPLAAALQPQPSRTGRRTAVASSSGLAVLRSRFAPAVEAPSRRTAVGLFGALAASRVAPALAADDGAFSVPPLPYAYGALEPHIDKETMKFHHDFHHAAYVKKLNGQVAGKPAKDILSLQAGAKAAKLNNAAGGHYNHCLFWSTMGPKCGGAPSGELAAAIDASFGSFDEFKKQFSAAAAGVFGSGWAWLVVAKGGKLAIASTPNQDNPLMDKDGGIPILGIDVWEHAYYLRYKNKRPDYIVRRAAAPSRPRAPPRRRAEARARPPAPFSLRAGRLLQRDRLVEGERVPRERQGGQGGRVLKVGRAGGA